MTEHATEALVLGKKNLGELDALVYLYTKNLGKALAKVKSSRKITSKLGGHLEPFNLVKVRLVEKNGLQAVDALTIKKFASGRPPLLVAKLLRITEFIKEMTFEYQRDYRLWLLIKKILASPEIEEKIIYRSLLKALGFDPKFAECAKCHGKKVYVFSQEEQKFLCQKCSFKILKDKVVFI